MSHAPSDKTTTPTDELERRLLRWLLDQMPMTDMAFNGKYWREIAEGKPEDRLYIAELIEGKRRV